jgi:malonyl-CoA decarboxylase
VSLCHDLLSERGGLSGVPLANDILGAYQSLDEAGRRAFFKFLIRDFSPDPEEVGSAADAYRRAPNFENLEHLQSVVEPPRQELFRRLNLAQEGTRALVEMRRDALREIDAGESLEPIASDLGHLLASWFNRGFLRLQRLDWRSSAAVLQKLIQYEAVHQIQGWDDLRRRLEADRRCYAFFHSGLPEDPLIFIEVALTRGMSDRVQPLLDPESPVEDPESADTAIFYSITNCQEGLRGVPFGSLLIKQVVEDLRSNLPRLRTFATLSPIPGFRKWLDTQSPVGPSMDGDPGKADLQTRQRVLRLCAEYLLHAKRGVEPLDPVARFHLKNGARLDRINWDADTSPAGLQQSGGLMANYVYDPEELERNHEQYVRSGQIACSRRVRILDRQASHVN